MPNVISHPYLTALPAWFGLATAAIPLVLAILTLYRNRTSKKTQTLDALSFRVLNIIRFPEEDHIWKRNRRKHLFKRLLLIFSLIFIAPLGAFILGLSFEDMLGTNLDNLIFGLIAIASWILAVIFSKLYLNSYTRRCSNANEARYFFFKEIHILIETDYIYLFNKCHEILREMGTQVIEINIYAHLLEAFFPGTIFSRARRIEIQIEAVEGKDRLYSIQVKVSPYAHHKKKGQVSVSSEESSKVINRFINHLISTTAGADKKTQKEIEPA